MPISATIPVVSSQEVTAELLVVELNFRYAEEGGEPSEACIRVPASKLPSQLRDWLEAKIKAHLEKTE